MVPSYMSSVDILVTPSVFKSETFCLVNLEAMALGIPVVSFGVYGMGDYMVGYNSSFDTPPNSLIATSASPLAIAEQVHALLRDQQLRSVISRNAVATARRYSERNAQQAFSQAMKSIYQALNGV
jgi:glycosyltransferase involved in cell wall biosynthesis